MSLISYLSHHQSVFIHPLMLIEFYKREFSNHQMLYLLILLQVKSK